MKTRVGKAAFGQESFSVTWLILTNVSEFAEQIFWLAIVVAIFPRRRILRSFFKNDAKNVLIKWKIISTWPGCAAVARFSIYQDLLGLSFPSLAFTFMMLFSTEVSLRNFQRLKTNFTDLAVVLESFSLFLNCLDLFLMHLAFKMVYSSHFGRKWNITYIAVVWCTIKVRTQFLGFLSRFFSLNMILTTTMCPQLFCWI